MSHHDDFLHDSDSSPVPPSPLDRLLSQVVCRDTQFFLSSILKSAQHLSCHSSPPFDTDAYVESLIGPPTSQQCRDLILSSIPLSRRDKTLFLLRAITPISTMNIDEGLECLKAEKLILNDIVKCHFHNTPPSISTMMDTIVNIGHVLDGPFSIFVEGWVEILQSVLRDEELKDSAQTCAQYSVENN